MATLVYAVLCQRVIIDQATNFVSYIDILDGVNVPKLPFAAPPSTVGTIWRIENENRLEMRVRVVSPDGQELTGATANPLDLKPTHQRGRMNVRVPSYEAPTSGTYSIEIDLWTDEGWQMRCQLPFQINLTESATKSEEAETRIPAKQVAGRVR